MTHQQEYEPNEQTCSDRDAATTTTKAKEAALCGGEDKKTRPALRLGWTGNGSLLLST